MLARVQYTLEAIPHLGLPEGSLDEVVNPEMPCVR